MKQIVNIKRVSVDSELKVAVTLEFIASNPQSKENVFSLIEMQGEVVEASFESSQQGLTMLIEFEINTKPVPQARPRFYVRHSGLKHIIGAYNLKKCKSFKEAMAWHAKIIAMEKAVKDALKGIIYADDCQIVEAHLYKTYGEPSIRVELQTIES